MYVTEEYKNRKQDDNDGRVEFEKIRKNLEDNVKHLRDNLDKGVDAHSEVNRRFMSQNVDLIGQINMLKQELHSYRKNINLINSENDVRAQQEWARATEEERELKLQDIQINELMAEIAHE